MNELIMKNDLIDMKEMEMLMKYCEIMSQAPAYQAMGGMPGVFALVMSARELGIGPMAALNGGMYLIPAGIDKDGKPKGSATIMMSARTMSMMIWKAGHKIEEIEANDRTVTLKGTRADNGVSMTVTMTMEKAKQAGLSHDIYGKPKLWSTWFKNSEDMLWKTCVAKLGRRLFTDVIGNCYEPAEFDEKEAKEISVKPEKKQLQGKNVEQLKIDEEQNQSYEEFIIAYGLDSDNSDMIAYVKECAIIKNMTFEEMLNYCYRNKEAFLNSFNNYKNEKI